jgi:hypothetical protein
MIPETKYLTLPTKSTILRGFLLCASFLLITGILSSPAQASMPLTFTPPTQITLKMYQLDEFGFILQPNNPCQLGDTRYGCTFFDGGTLGPPAPAKPYPFPSNTIPIDIEGYMFNNIQQGYLHNVISQEMAEGSPVASYTAQAIAARTYAYYQSNGGTVTINNSGAGGGGLPAYQVYLPFRYDGLGEGLGAAIKTERQNTVNQAIIGPGPLYMTIPSNNNPIIAFFGADNCTFTEDNTPPSYLTSIYDPISEKPEPCDNGALGTPNGGMGSAGASRWGYGNKSQYGTGDDWSVSWGSGLQIVTHYYTGIHIRNGSGNIVTPQYRWNPLRVNSTFPPSMMNPGSVYQMGFTVQNTGILAWDASVNSYRPAYQWQTLAGTVLSEGAGVIYSSYLSPGSYNFQTFVDIVTPSTPGVYRLVVDMQVQIGGNYQYFRNREPGKPWYPLEYICVVGGSGSCSSPEEFFGEPIYLPIVMKNAS